MPFIGVQPASALLTSADIQDGQITTAKIADTAVTTAKITDDAVTGSKIENSPTIANGITLTDGDISFASGHGINFASASGSGSGSASALLDDYEEGTWTPTIIGAGGGVKTVGSNNVGRYQRVGNHCTISGTAHCNGSETLSGAIAMGGLPFTVSNISNYRCSCALGGTSGLGMPSGYTNGFAMSADPNATFVYIVARSTSGYSHNPTVADQTHLFGINMTYLIN